MSMKRFSLSNLRELTTEEQMRLNGGYGSPCDSGCSCACCCSCECDTKTPDGSMTGSSKDRALQVNYNTNNRELLKRRAEELGY